MAISLKVTWQDGPSGLGNGQPIATATVPAYRLATTVIGETLVFRQGDQAGQVYLIIPEQRLISAVPVDDAA